jgi:uncharacterized protein
VSKGLPSREQALNILRANNCSAKVIDHCIAVADLAGEVAQKLQEKGLKINLQLVEAGALLHDLGRSKTHSVSHAVVGAEIAQSEGLPDSVVKIIKRHVGGGITAQEAQQLGWPKDVYVPQTLEEKIVSYADKLIEQSRIAPVESTIDQLRSEGKPEAAERVRKLHEEMLGLLEQK